MTPTSPRPLTTPRLLVTSPRPTTISSQVQLHPWRPHRHKFELHNASEAAGSALTPSFLKTVFKIAISDQRSDSPRTKSTRHYLLLLPTLWLQLLAQIIPKPPSVWRWTSPPWGLSWPQLHLQAQYCPRPYNCIVTNTSTPCLHIAQTVYLRG